MAVKPLVFLDKSDAIVEFQLARLSNSQLLAVISEKHATTPLLLEAILQRRGMARQDQMAAVRGLAVLNKTDVTRELLAAIGRLEDQQAAATAIAKQLTMQLLRQPVAELKRHSNVLRKVAVSENALARIAAIAALLTIDDAGSAWNLASRSPNQRADFLQAIPLVRNAKQRAELRDRVVVCLDSSMPIGVRAPQPFRAGSLAE